MSFNGRKTYDVNINVLSKEKIIIIKKEDENDSKISLNIEKKNKVILNLNNSEITDDLEIIIKLNNKEYEIFEIIEIYEKLNNNSNNSKSIPEKNKPNISSNEFNNKNNDKKSIIGTKNFKMNTQKDIITKNKENSITSKETNIAIKKSRKDDFKISLGINIGSMKTVYSTFSKIDDKNYITKVLLMDNSSRTIPSIICYTKTHRLFGEYSKSALKQNLNTSYNNLSRIIGYDKHIDLYKDEYKYSFKNLKNIDSFNVNIQEYNSNIEKEKKSEFIIADFLSLINDYFEKEKIDYTSTSISVPDFYTINQNKELKLICESIGMKNVKIINESTAISMYYIYNQFNNLFELKENIYSNTRYILFIDAGHSKTSFILSKFKYNEFKVEYVLCDDNLGGRNFDELIFNYCIEEFKKENKLTNIEITDKMKYNLIDSITKERIKLSVNTEVSIYVDVFYNDIDLNITLKRDKFEKLILNLIGGFKKSLLKILDYSNIEEININEVEIAGEIMRTPIFQRVVENNKLKISKGILIDECCSVGVAILNKFIEKDFPIKSLEHFYHYNYYEIQYEINYDDINKETHILLPQKSIETKVIEIKFNKNYVSKNKPLTIKVFFSNTDRINKENTLFVIEVKLNEILQIYKDKIKNNNYPIFKMKYNNKQSFSNLSIKIGSEEVKKYFNFISKGIIKSKDEEKEFQNNINQNIKQQKINDEEHSKMLDETIELSKNFYSLKKYSDNNNLKEELNNILSCINELRSNDYSLTEIKKKYEEIKKQLTNKGYKE